VTPAGCNHRASGCNCCRNGVQQLHPNRPWNHPQNRPPPTRAHARPVRPQPMIGRGLAGARGNSSSAWGRAGRWRTASDAGLRPCWLTRWRPAGIRVGWRRSWARTPQACVARSRCWPPGCRPASCPRRLAAREPGRLGAARTAATSALATGNAPMARTRAAVRAAIRSRPNMLPEQAWPQAPVPAIHRQQPCPRRWGQRPVHTKAGRWVPCCRPARDAASRAGPCLPAAGPSRTPRRPASARAAPTPFTGGSRRGLSARPATFQVVTQGGLDDD
jgi:hypothetical protein